MKTMVKTTLISSAATEKIMRTTGLEFFASSSVEEEDEDEDDVQPYSYFGNNSFEDDHIVHRS